MEPPSTRPVSLFPVLLVNFIGMLGYSIIIPMLVFLVQKFGGNEFIYGLLGATYPALQLVGAPLLGKWSDSIGRKRVLLVSQIGTLIAWGLFTLALLLPQNPLFTVAGGIGGAFFVTAPLIILFFARALDGITGGNVSVANAYLSDISTDENRKANFGKMASSTSLGFILGPTIASVLGATVYGELIPVLAAALISLIAIFVIYRYLPESKTDLVEPNLPAFSLGKMFHIEHKECYEQEHCPDTGLKAILKLPQIPVLFVIYFITFLGFSFYYAGFPLYAANKLGWGPSQLGLYLAIASGIMVLVQGPVLTYLSQRVSDISLVIVGSALIALSFFLFPTGTLTGVYIANFCLAVGNGLMWPSYLAILARSGTPDIQGTIQGYANSMGSLASIFGLVLGGVLFGRLGETVFFVAGVMLLLITVIALRMAFRDPPAQELQAE